MSAPYRKSANTISLGGESFEDTWKWESSVMGEIQLRMKGDYPRRCRRDIAPAGVFRSGKPRFMWYLINLSNPECETVVEQHYAMEMTNKKTGAPYYLINKHIAADESAFVLVSANPTPCDGRSDDEIRAAAV
jgi:hypothetical protein